VLALAFDALVCSGSKVAFAYPKMRLFVCAHTHTMSLREAALAKNVPSTQFSASTVGKACLETSKTSHVTRQSTTTPMVNWSKWCSLSLDPLSTPLSLAKQSYNARISIADPPGLGSAVSAMRSLGCRSSNVMVTPGA